MRLRDLAPFGLLPWKWRVVITGSLIVGLAVWIALGVPGVRAQQLDPLATVQVYLTASPNDPAVLGLATPNGRYAVVVDNCFDPTCSAPNPACGGVFEGQNVLAYPNWLMPPFLAITPIDQAASDLHSPVCLVAIQGRMDATPCFTGEAGVCDVSKESDASD